MNLHHVTLLSCNVSHVSCTKTNTRLTYLKLFKLIELRFYIPLKTKIGNFRYVLPSQLLSILLKKPNTTKKQICINKSKNVITQKTDIKTKARFDCLVWRPARGMDRAVAVSSLTKANDLPKAMYDTDLVDWSCNSNCCSWADTLRTAAVRLRTFDSCDKSSVQQHTTLNAIYTQTHTLLSYLNLSAFSPKCCDWLPECLWHFICKKTRVIQ